METLSQEGSVRADEWFTKRAAKMLVSPIPNTDPPIMNVCRCEMHLLPHWFMSVQK